MSPRWQFSKSSLIGVSIVNSQVVWASGSFDLLRVGEPELPGVVLRTRDGGSLWKDVTPHGTRQFHFHDIEAIDANHAVALALPPGLDGPDFRIYVTDDGGDSWQLAFQNYDPNAFYDDIAFFDHHRGLALSDPVNGRFRIARTHDSGHSWVVAPSNGMPAALDGEAVRATGTSLVTSGPHDAWFGTVQFGEMPLPPSRVFHTRNRGDTWTVAVAPSIPGYHPLNEQFGIASLTFRDTQHGWALGGGWPEPETPSVVARTDDGGTTWSPAGTLNGFRVSIAVVPSSAGDVLVAVGRSGSDVSTDGGNTWQLIDHRDLRGVSSKAHVSCWAVGADEATAALAL